MTAAVVRDPDAEDPAPEGDGVSTGGSFLEAALSLEEPPLLAEPLASADALLETAAAADDSPAAMIADQGCV